MLNAAGRAATVRQRVFWLRQAASAWAAALGDVVACRSGCSHCCHIPLAITDIEAKLIGQQIRRTPASPQGAVSSRALVDDPHLLLPVTPPNDAGYTQPCPFLEDDRCSIYEHRPMACRTHLNLDADDLPCRLIPGVKVPFPYAEATQLKACYVLAQPTANWADIRAFFPKQ